MRNLIGLILLLIIICYSCSKDKEYVAPDIGHDYAGLTLGKYVIYDVDSFYFNDFDGSIDTSLYQIKEVVDSRYTDLEGDEAFKIIRYKKVIDSVGWYIEDVWNSKITNTTYQKVEENLRFVKLIFPVRANVTWNGNSMNNLGKMDYEYTFVDSDDIVGGNSLNNVLTVLQYEDLNLIKQEQFEEKYAKGIGMVYKKSMSKVRGSLSGSWLGYEITMTLSSYGG